MAAFESTLERDLFLCLEFDPSVAAYEEQPVQLAYSEGPKRRRYTPDVLVTFNDGRSRLLVEVKYRRQLTDDVAGARRWARAARQFAAEHGWMFRVLTEREIRSPYLENATFLLPYRRQIRDSRAEERISAALTRLGDTSAAELLASITSDPEEAARLLPSLWALVADGDAAVDRATRVSMSARIGRVMHPRGVAPPSPWLLPAGCTRLR